MAQLKDTVVSGSLRATDNIYAAAFKGNADTATAFSADKSVTLTGDVTGSASSTGGWSISTTLANSGATAGSYGDSSNQTPDYGSTFKVPYVTVDNKGRVTSISEHTVKIPANDIPSVTTSDNGKILRVVNGAWAAVELPSASGVSF